METHIFSFIDIILYIILVFKLFSNGVFFLEAQRMTNRARNNGLKYKVEITSVENQYLISGFLSLLVMIYTLYLSIYFLNQISKESSPATAFELGKK